MPAPGALGRPQPPSALSASGCAATSLAQAERHAGPSLRRLQECYRQERQVVLEELRLAKEEAEAERRRILKRIGNTLAHGGWS